MIRPKKPVADEAGNLESDQTQSDTYRTEYNEEDLALAGLYWEGCWTESIVDRFYDAVRKISESNPESNGPSRTRLPYRMASDPDTTGQIDRHSFLPIYEINGTDRAIDPEGSFEGSKARRLGYKLSQIRRLEDFPGRVLMVVGAQEIEDLLEIETALDFIPTNTTVVILWPPGKSLPDPRQFSSRVEVLFVTGSRKELADTLFAENAPKPVSSHEFGIRYGRETIGLQEEDLFGVSNHFALILHNDLALSRKEDQPESILERLWRAETDDWLPISSELVFRRHYRPFETETKDLTDYIRSQLQDPRRSDQSSNLSLTIPATSGSGITTSLRHAAFFAARSGFPTLLCRPTGHGFSSERLAAFLTRLQEKAKEQGITEELPALIIFDREHSRIAQVYELAAVLSSQGRPALVVNVLPPSLGKDEDLPTWRPRGYYKKAQDFRGSLDEQELSDVSKHFSDIYGSFGFDTPSIEDWKAFQSNQMIKSMGSEIDQESLFWVALRFFIGERNPNFDIADWVNRAIGDRVRGPAAREAIGSIAAFSSFGIAVLTLPLKLY